MGHLWYLPYMKKASTTKRASKETTAVGDRLAKTVEERMRMNLNLLQQLAFAVAASEKAQIRFRAAIVSRIVKIETTIQMIYGAQIAEAHDSFDSERMRKHATDADKTIAKASEKLGIAMMNFIYEEENPSVRRSGRRCK